MIESVSLCPISVPFYFESWISLFVSKKSEPKCFCFLFSFFNKFHFVFIYFLTVRWTILFYLYLFNEREHFLRFCVLFNEICRSTSRSRHVLNRSQEYLQIASSFFHLYLLFINRSHSIHLNPPHNKNHRVIHFLGHVTTTTLQANPERNNM